jgi:hypothetical protein
LESEEHGNPGVGGGGCCDGRGSGGRDAADKTEKECAILAGPVVLFFRPAIALVHMNVMDAGWGIRIKVLTGIGMGLTGIIKEITKDKDLGLWIIHGLLYPGIDIIVEIIPIII